MGSPRFSEVTAARVLGTGHTEPLGCGLPGRGGAGLPWRRLPLGTWTANCICQKLLNAWFQRQPHRGQSPRWPGQQSQSFSPQDPGEGESRGREALQTCPSRFHRNLLPAHRASEGALLDEVWAWGVLRLQDARGHLSWAGGGGLLPPGYFAPPPKSDPSFCSAQRSTDEGLTNLVRHHTHMHAHMHTYAHTHAHAQAHARTQKLISRRRTGFKETVGNLSLPSLISRTPWPYAGY